MFHSCEWLLGRTWPQGTELNRIPLAPKHLPTGSSRPLLGSAWSGITPLGPGGTLGWGFSQASRGQFQVRKSQWAIPSVRCHRGEYHQADGDDSLCCFSETCGNWERLCSVREVGVLVWTVTGHAACSVVLLKFPLVQHVLFTLLFLGN